MNMYKTLVKKIIDYYWVIPIVLGLLQAVYTFRSFNQILWEELSESVRNVYFFKHHLIYHPISINLGWYAVLHVIYSMVGFSFFSAKIYRIVLVVIGLYCLADMLRKHMGKGRAVIPLLTFGLSPTLLYFNTIAISIGVEVYYFFICLWLIDGLPLSEKIPPATVFRLFAIGFFLMLGWLTYPSFVFLLVVAVVYLWKKGNQLKKFIIVVLGFLTPLVGLFFFITNTALFFPHDRDGSGGLFRGNGQIEWGSTAALVHNLRVLSSDFFFKPISYYYELPKGEFSDILPLFSLVLLLVMSMVVVYKDKRSRLPILLLLAVVSGNVFFVVLSAGASNLAGARRLTPALTAIYGIFAIVWTWLLSQKARTLKSTVLIAAVLLMIPFHHALVIPVNVLRRADPSRFVDNAWFSGKKSPTEILEDMTAILKNRDLPLACQNAQGQAIYCRYNEVYAALKANCEYNAIACHTILGYDPQKDTFIPLDVYTWDDGPFDK